MTNQVQRAALFAALHQQGRPIILYNVWDAGSARAVVDAGAAAVATGSASVAEAQGYADGQNIPLDLLLTVARRIVASVDVPVSVDFEGGYAVEPAELEGTTARLLDTGAIGVNFEDQVVGGEGLYPVATQVDRIRAVRRAAERFGVDLFINARTDLFLKSTDPASHPGLMPEAIERAKAYAEAGASGFFAPLLGEPALIKTLCEATSLPVNIMAFSKAPPNAEIARCGAARISYGPRPYRAAMKSLRESATEVFGR